jgi:uridine phosphorylase
VKVHHLDAAQTDIGRIVFLPGDPDRSQRIAGHFDAPRFIARRREFDLWSGTVEGLPVSVCSTGIGGPSTAIAVEELALLGADTFVRIGSAGILQDWIEPDDVVIAHAAVRDEGTSRQYVPLEYPAVATFEVTAAMAAAARSLGIRARVGVVHSKDAFFGEVHPESMPDPAAWRDANALLARMGVLASEMEAAALYTVAQARGLRAGCILASGNMEHAIRVAVAAVPRLAAEATP